MAAVKNSEDKNLNTVSIGKHKYFFTHLDFGLIGWTGYSYYLMDKILFDINLLRTLILIISLVSIIAGVCSVILYNSKVFAPIKRIERLIVQNYGQNSNMNDHGFIASFTEKLIRSNIDLSAVIKNNQITLRGKLLEDIINKKISDYEIKQRWKSLFSGWTSDMFIVAVISIDNYYQWKSTYNETDEFLLKYSLSNIVSEILSEGFNCVGFDNSADKIIYLIQPQNEENVQAVKNYFERIIKAANDILKISISFGVSNVFCDNIKIKKAYREADGVLLQRLYNGYSYIGFSAEQMLNENNTAFRVLEDKTIDGICNAVETDNSQIALDIIKNNCLYFRKNEIDPRIVISYFHKVLYGLKSRLSCDEDSELIDPYMLYTISLDDLQKQFDNMITRLISLSGKNQKSKEEEIVEKMCEFMNAHYSEDISINDVCNAVGLSFSHTSVLFKKITNKTIHEYLTNIRITKANELLANSSMTIVEIATKVGYQNETSFRRVYKKVQLVTPGEYRDICKKKVAYSK